MAKPFMALRGLMTSRGMDQSDLAKLLKVSRVNISQKLCAKADFRLEEIWTIAEALDIPEGKIMSYFPQGGINDKSVVLERTRR